MYKTTGTKDEGGESMVRNAFRVLMQEYVDRLLNLARVRGPVGVTVVDAVSVQDEMRLPMGTGIRALHRLSRLDRDYDGHRLVQHFISNTDGTEVPYADVAQILRGIDCKDMELRGAAEKAAHGIRVVWVLERVVVDPMVGHDSATGCAA